MRVWITRTRPGADQTAARLGALGVDSLIDPVLEVRALAVELDTADFETLAFTSPNGVAVFAERCATRDLPAFAVGEATAAALRQAGFERVEAAEGDLKSLARLLEARRPGRILALGPTEPAGDLAALANGASIEVLSIYDTTARRPVDALAARDLGAVMVHSAKAARVIAGVADHIKAMRVLALSEACAAPLRTLAARSIEVAPFPDDASLARLAVDTLSDAQP